jgi:thiol-disulfide isomerase/thioredoxin
MSDKLNPHGVILKASDFAVRGQTVTVNPRKTGGVPGMLLIWGNFCIHCHRFLPTFNEIADNIGNGYVCASIESAELNGNDNLMKALNFDGYPTILFFDKSGQIIGKYEGNREKSSVLSTICKVYHHCVMK